MAANAAADAVCGMLNGGSLLLVDSGMKLIAEIPVEFNEAIDGTASTDELLGTATDTGVVSWFQAVTSRGVVVMEGTVGGTGSDIVIEDDYIEAGDEVSVQFSYELRKD